MQLLSKLVDFYYGLVISRWSKSTWNTIANKLDEIAENVVLFKFFSFQNLEVIFRCMYGNNLVKNGY